MTAAPTIIDTPSGAGAIEPTNVSIATAFRALLLRDLFVLRKNLKEFLPRTVLQPLLLVFVFTYVFPTIGQGIGGTGSAAEAARFSTMLVAGVLAPLPIELVAIAKVVSGTLQCMLAAVIVFPIAYFVPATPVNIDFNWPVLLTLGPLACLAAASLGLFFGTAFDPRTVPLLFGIVVVPLTFLGCIYFPWTELSAIRWLQILVLANPLVYMSEGFRAAITPEAHMPLLLVYPVLAGFAAFFLWRGISGFTKRVLT